MKLEIQDVAFEYESEPVLDGVNLEIDKGEVFGIIGPNGSGKSTLLRCINRILKPHEGTVFYDDTDLHETTREEIARTIGYVPQEETSTFPATVFDTILMGRKPYIKWRPTDADRQRVTEIIELLGLAEFTLRDVNELSGGQRQKVLIGRALAQDAEVLLLDEPTSSLDIKHQLEVLDVIRGQADRGIMAILAMHDLNLAARYCDKLAMLFDERIYAAGTPDILTSENIRHVYDVDVTILNHNGRRIVIPEESASDTPIGSLPAESYHD